MVFIEHEDMRKNLVEWAEYYGLPYKVLQVRYSRHGDNPDKLFAPYKDRGGCALMFGQKKFIGVKTSKDLYLYQGKEQNLWRWAEELGIPYKTLEMRVRRGKRGVEVFAPARMYIPVKKYVG